MKSAALTIGIISMAISLTKTVSAAPWPPNGRNILEHGIPPAVPACVSCHGPSLGGDTAAGAPALRGMSAVDLMDDLYAEVHDKNDHSSMARITRHLNVAERAAVTAYIAGHFPATAPAS